MVKQVLSKYREALMGFLKYVSPIVTLQTTVKYRIEMALLGTIFTDKKVKRFTVKRVKEEKEPVKNNFNEQQQDYRRFGHK